MIRLQQLLVVLLGLGAATAMAVLGVWQLEVFAAQGREAAAARAAQPPVALLDVAPAGARVGDGYGRTVLVRGEYLPATQLLLPMEGQPGRVRVLTALRQADGSVVPVVRGVSAEGKVPAPPTGPLDQTGVFLPSDQAPDRAADGPARTVRVPALAQTWPGPLVSGYVTLAVAGAQAQGLEPAAAELPEAQGRLRNGAYALQWWVFAAFAVGMAVKIARDLEVREVLEAAVPEPAVVQEAGPEPAPARDH